MIHGGEIGDYIRGLYIHPAMKTLIDRSMCSYQNPNTFFRLLNYLTKEYAFANGMHECGEYLKFGIELGNLLNWLNASKENRNNIYIENQMQFCSRALVNSFYEVGLSFKNMPALKLSTDHVDESIKSIEIFINWFLQQLEYVEYDCFLIGLTYYFFFDEKNNYTNVKTSHSELYASFIENIYQLLLNMLCNYLDIHKGTKKSNDIVLVCAKIFVDFNMHKWNSSSQLDTIINGMNINEFRIQMQNTEDEFKFNFARDNAYRIFNLFKAISFCKESKTDLSSSVKVALKHADINWLLEQINQFTDIYPNAAPIIHIYEDENVSVEVSKEPSDLLLKRNLKDDEVIIKISKHIIDTCIIKKINELLSL